MKGFIYVRIHDAYDMYGACKLGKTRNIPDRDSQYSTGEIKRGYFEVVFEVQNEDTDRIEVLLQNEFREFNIKYDGGREFYDKQIISQIEPCLIQLGIEYKKLTKDEVRHLIRCCRIKKIITKINVQTLIQHLKCETSNEVVSYIPRNDQSIIIEKSVIHFQQHDKGILVLMCGVGKTLISLWTAQQLKTNTILIGVPNILLLKQWEQVIRMLFQGVHTLTVSGNVTIEEIVQFLEKNKSKQCIVITTYASSYKVYNATQYTNFVFDMKINDEVHHLTTTNMRIAHTTKSYVQMLNIPCMKQLSLTATLKHLENVSENGEIVSNDNVDYFGEIMDKKSLLWAIDQNIICDYVIQTIITKEEKIEHQLSKFHIIEENDKRLFLSAYASLKSIFDGHSHHVLIYSNNTENSMKLVDYIKMLLDEAYFHIHDLYSSNYHSEMKSKVQKGILRNFEKAKFGIISCVYCLGE